MALNWVQMKNHSIMLVAAYRRLIEERPREDGQPGVEVPKPAALVMAALAIEIRFKSLICRQRNITDVVQLKALKVPDGGHNLYELYQLLDDETKFMLSAGFDKYYGGNIETMIVTNGFIDDDQLEGLLTPKSFDEELMRASRTFMDWRYSYELDHVGSHLSFVKYLIDRLSVIF